MVKKYNSNTMHVFNKMKIFHHGVLPIICFFVFLSGFSKII